MKNNQVFLFYLAACTIVLVGCDGNSNAANADTRSDHQPIEDVASKLHLAPINAVWDQNAVGTPSLSNSLQDEKPLIELQ